MRPHLEKALQSKTEAEEQAQSLAKDVRFKKPNLALATACATADNHPVVNFVANPKVQAACFAR